MRGLWSYYLTIDSIRAELRTSCPTAEELKAAVAELLANTADLIQSPAKLPAAIQKVDNAIQL